MMDGHDVSDRRRELADDYVRALQQYLSEPEEPALARAYELGRKALTDGLGLLAMANAHSRALAIVLNGAGPDHDALTRLAQLETFLVEALSPFEMAHRGFWEANCVLRRLNDMLEAQAKRIASALHDETGQLLACVHLALASTADKLPPEGAQEIHGARRLLEQTEQRLRKLAHELRPPILDDLGLVAALDFLIDGVSKRWGFTVSLQVSMHGSLKPTLETTLYRITQEALNNIVRHAHATHATVIVEQRAHQIACSIADDGVGPSADILGAGKSAWGMGLREIQERVGALGGSFRIAANAPRGTVLIVEIPLER